MQHIPKKSYFGYPLVTAQMRGCGLDLSKYYLLVPQRGVLGVPFVRQFEEVDEVTFGHRVYDIYGPVPNPYTLLEMAHNAERKIEAIEPDAKRWRAFISSARIRLFGWAGLDKELRPNQDGSNYVHFGGEFWTIHDAPDVPENRAVVTAYADAAVVRMEELEARKVSKGADFADRVDASSKHPIPGESPNDRLAAYAEAFVAGVNDFKVVHGHPDVIVRDPDYPDDNVGLGSTIMGTIGRM